MTITTKAKVFEWRGHKFILKTQVYVSPVEPPKKCALCNGRGKHGISFSSYDYEEDDCPDCLGRGTELRHFPDPNEPGLLKYLNGCLDKFIEERNYRFEE